MKVALVVPGGVDRTGTHRVIPCLLALVERLAREHEVHVFALYQEPTACSYPLLGATVHCVGAGRGASLRAVAAVLREHRRGRFQLLHAMFGGAGLPAAVAARLLRLPLMVHLAGGELVAIRDIGYGGWLSWGSRTRLRFTLASATRVTAPSGPMVARAAELGIRAELLTYGIDRQVWPAEPPRRRAATEARLLFVASLNAVKDPWTVVRAAAVLRDRGVPFRLEMIGVDTLGGAIQALAADLGVDEHVQVSGFLTQAELRPRMLAADLLLLTSRHEAGPLVMLEAAACGVPTVGAGVGHLAEWAPDAAVRVRAQDPAALAEAVVALLDDEEERLRLARAAQERALACDADHAARRVLALYREIAAVR